MNMRKLNSSQLLICHADLSHITTRVKQQNIQQETMRQRIYQQRTKRIAVSERLVEREVLRFQAHDRFERRIHLRDKGIGPVKYVFKIELGSLYLGRIEISVCLVSSTELLAGSDGHLEPMLAKDNVAGIQQEWNTGMSNDISVSSGRATYFNCKILPFVRRQKQLPSIRSELRGGGTEQKRRDLLADLFSSSFDGLEFLLHNFTAKKIQGLDLRGSLPYRSNAHVAKNLLLFVGLDVAVPAVHLDAHAGGFKTGLSEEPLQKETEKTRRTRSNVKTKGNRP